MEKNLSSDVKRLSGNLFMTENEDRSRERPAYENEFQIFYCGFIFEISVNMTSQKHVPLSIFTTHKSLSSPPPDLIC